MKLRPAFLPTLASFLLVNLAFVSPAAAEWVKVKEKNGITVYEEKTDSPLVAFRGEGIVQAPLALVASVIFDPARAKEWIEDLEETRVVNWFDDHEYLEYDHMGMPFIIKDRDFASRVTLEFDTSKSQMKFTYRNAADADVPQDLKKSVGVRGDLNGTCYTLVSVDGGKSTLVTAEVHADPKGLIPKWVVNLFQRDWPVDTLSALRIQVAKPDVKRDDKIVTLLKSRLPQAVQGL